MGANWATSSRIATASVSGTGVRQRIRQSVTTNGKHTSRTATVQPFPRDSGADTGAGGFGHPFDITAAQPGRQSSWHNHPQCIASIRAGASPPDDLRSVRLAFLFLVAALSVAGLASAQSEDDPRAQLPRLLRDSYFSINVGSLETPLSDRQLATGLRRRDRRDAPRRRTRAALRTRVQPIRGVPGGLPAPGELHQLTAA